MKLTSELLDGARADSIESESVLDVRQRVGASRKFTPLEHEVFERRKRMIATVAVEPLADAFERLVGDNDLLPMNYLRIGYLQSKSVGRIRYLDRAEGEQALATGFLVSERLILTNHHVFPVDDPVQFQAFAADAVVEFNFEFDIDGNLPGLVSFELDPATFLHTSKELDMALIGVRPFDRTGQHALKDQGYLVLNGDLGKVEVGDFASIIEHPDGREKQISIRENKVTNIDLADFVLYVSDTAEGSSGAPVFNDQWQVIALHSAGVAKTNRQGKYVDKRGKVVEAINGRYDEHRLVWDSNRGIRISSIMKHLRTDSAAATNPLVQELFLPAYTDSRPYAFLSRPRTDDTERLTAPTVVLPDAATTKPIAVTINIGADGQIVTATTPSVIPGATATFTEKYEDDVDFADCPGFDDHFMGVYVPMPSPSPSLLKHLAPLINSPGSYTLKYPNFSTLHHAVRHVPIVSGINVPKAMRHEELGKGTRDDHWYRDKRIDFDVQLNDAFYEKSGFDKGHLSRREDAEWGTSIDAAKRAADMTCSYANAVPQVPALNRAAFGFHGKWGELEKELLEQGVKGESGKSARICVFNGPLFAADDPVFKGIQVALSFYKVVVWFDGDGKLRTTCYKLSQEEFVGQIDFVEVLRFDEVFKTSQVPIRQIQRITGLKFHPTIVKADTSAGEEVPVG